MTVVGMMGAKGSGKDSFASVLVARGMARVAFADPMRSALLALDPLVESATPDGAQRVGVYNRLSDVIRWYGWDTAKRTFPEVRRLMQAHGVAIRDHVGEDVWVERTRREIASLIRDGRDVVVTDVRFPNEVRLIRAFGGLLVAIDRPGFGGDDSHVSETAIDPRREADVVVLNNTTLDRLHYSANSFFDRYVGPND